MIKSAYRFKINSEEWINHGRWVQAPLSGCFWCYWNSPKSLKEITRQTEFDNPLFFDGYLLTKKSDMAAMRKILVWLIERKKISDFTRSFVKVATKYEKFHLNVLKEKNKNPKAYLPRLFETYQDLIGIWNFSIFFGDEIQKYLLEKYPKLSEENILDESEGLTKKTWLEGQSSEIRGFALEIRRKVKNNIKINHSFLLNSPVLSKKIDMHVKKYRWFGTHHWAGEPYNRGKCLEEISEVILSKSIKSKKILKSSSKSDLLKLLAAMTYWRTHCAEVTCKVVFESRLVLEKYAKNNNIIYDQLLQFSHKEILDNLNSKRSAFSRKIIAGREKGYGCFVDSSGEETIVTGKKLKKLVRQITKKIEKNSFLKGTIVSRGGRAKGKAKVLISPKDFQKFKKGDILVASETAPDFVPCMKKAAAIVTERGGLTSHAAIVSRELGTPCLIGVKDATRIIRDGDFVEVDTDKGVVKIINKKK